MSTGELVEDLGTLSLVGQAIEYRSSFYPPWSLPVAELRLVGEYTNEDGPHAADHFLVFFGSVKQTCEAPVDADGVIPVLNALAEILKGSLKPELRFNTSFASRVIWPPQLCGQPVFAFHQRRVFESMTSSAD
jgi:hypothetical protein